MPSICSPPWKLTNDIYFLYLSSGTSELKHITIRKCSLLVWIVGISSNNPNILKNVVIRNKYPLIILISVIFTSNQRSLTTIGSTIQIDCTSARFTTPYNCIHNIFRSVTPWSLIITKHRFVITCPQYGSFFIIS